MAPRRSAAPRTRRSSGSSSASRPADGVRCGRPPRANYEDVRDLVAQRSRPSGPGQREAAAAQGPGRGLCRVGPQLPAAGGRGEAAVPARRHGRGRRPAVWSPGEHLVIDWGVHGRAARVLRGAGLVAGAVRAVRGGRAGGHDAGDAGRVLRGPRRGAEGGARGPDGLPEGRGGREPCGPDRATMSGSPTHYGFRPDFCEGADPESKGIVENLVGYAKDATCCSPPGDGSRSGGCAQCRRSGRGERGARRRGARRSTRRCTARSARSRPSGWSPSGSCSPRCRRCARASGRRR